jgi:hypothetical protein
MAGRPPKEQPKQVQPTVQQVPPPTAQPIIGVTTQVFHGQKTFLLDTTTGSKKAMTFDSASRMARKYPKIYKVVFE